MQLNFLGSGPIFDLEFSDLGFGPARMTTVMDWGGGGRTVAASHVADPANPVSAGADLPPFNNPEYFVESTSDTASGVAEVRFRPDPGTWAIRWRVGDYTVTTHVREVEGRETVSLVLDQLTWATVRSTGLPMAVIGSGIRYAPADFPGYQEEVAFADTMERERTAGDVLALSIQRPSGMSRSLVKRFFGGYTTLTRTGRGDGMEIQVTTLGDEDDAQASSAVASLLDQLLV
jgi:hypothetical protein